MYCQSCGIAIAHSMRFCNRCGTSVVSQDAADTKRSEKRLDDYLDGLFWITVMGVAITAGGMLVLKKADLGDKFLLAFMILSSTAFFINFAISLWMVLGMVRGAKDKKALPPLPPDTNELAPMDGAPMLQPAASVTENTTRSFEPIYNKRNSD
jgi:hypothetical protein